MLLHQNHSPPHLMKPTSLFFLCQRQNASRYLLICWSSARPGRPVPTSRWTEEGKYKGFNANVDKNLPYHLIFQADKWQPGLEGGNRNFLSRTQFVLASQLDNRQEQQRVCGGYPGLQLNAQQNLRRISS